jgi:hypothetical protein
VCKKKGDGSAFGERGAVPGFSLPSEIAVYVTENSPARSLKAIKNVVRLAEDDKPFALGHDQELVPRSDVKVLPSLLGKHNSILGADLDGGHGHLLYCCTF